MHGEKIRKFAEEFGGITKLAREIDVDPSQMHRWIKETAEPTRPILAKFKMAGLDMNWLLDDKRAIDEPLPSFAKELNIAGDINNRIESFFDAINANDIDPDTIALSRNFHEFIEIVKTLVKLNGLIIREVNMITGNCSTYNNVMNDIQLHSQELKRKLLLILKSDRQ